jgi:hypothetical protein
MSQLRWEVTTDKGTFIVLWDGLNGFTVEGVHGEGLIFREEEELIVVNKNFRPYGNFGTVRAGGIKELMLVS